MAKKIDQLTLRPEEIQQAALQAILATEARAVAERKVIRRARQKAAERTAEQNRERRARAHRLIRLGAEVEASGLADILGHDPDAISGMLTTIAEKAGKDRAKLPIAQFAQIGRTRREKAALSQPPSAASAPANEKRKGRSLPSGRVAIRFPSPPPTALRGLLRTLGYRWRLGLRSWVGDAPLDEQTTSIVAKFGGEILSGPDVALEPPPS